MVTYQIETNTVKEGQGLPYVPIFNQYPNAENPQVFTDEDAAYGKIMELKKLDELVSALIVKYRDGVKVSAKQVSFR